MSVRLLPAAQVELDEANHWYAQQAPGLGDSFLVEFLRRFPYGVIYSQDEQGILIVAVAHLHRRPAHWQSRVN